MKAVVPGEGLEQAVSRSEPPAPTFPESPLPRERGDRDGPAEGKVARILDHLFRHESGKMVATLTGIFGIEHLSLAEDVVQEALVRALRTWPFYGIPANPSAWIMRASRNLALDVVRRQKVFRDKEPEITALIEGADSGAEMPVFVEEEIEDHRLRLMFACCHPRIPPEAQVALALKTLGGFSVIEISRAFLTTEAAIAKRLVRARQQIRDERIPFEIPAGEELARRLESVLPALYLLFNEGYKASSGEQLVRQEVCREAIRLTTLLAQHPAGNRPNTHALLALMLLNAARFATRVDEEGNLLRLQEQDRTRWDQKMMAQGMFHLAQSAAGDQISAYHLQAGIAACHCAARDYASTDWEQILALYDLLIRCDPSPVAALNRAVALANSAGAQAGLEAVEAIPGIKKLKSYYLLYAVLGEFEERLNRPEIAKRHFQKALDLAESKTERMFLSRRLRGLEAPRQ